MTRAIRRYWKGTGVFLGVFVLSQMYRAPTEGGLIVSLVYSIRDLVASALLGYGVSVVVLRKQILELMAGQERLPAVLRPALASYVGALISEAVKGVNGICEEGGAILTREGMRQVIDGAFLQHGAKHWVVVQRVVPSSFLDTFPTFNDVHFSEKRLHHPGRDVRILLVSQEDLREDARKHPISFRLFYEANRTHHVTILQVDPEKAAQNLEKLLKSSLFVFGRDFTVTLQEVGGTTGSEESRFVVRSQAIDASWRLELREILRRLNAHATELKMVGRTELAFRSHAGEQEITHESYVLWSLG